MKKSAAGPPTYATRLVKRRRLSEKAFEIELTRPQDFIFTPGQSIRLRCGGIERDYSLVSGPSDATLAVCIQHVRQGRMSNLLAAMAIGGRVHFSGPGGYFTFRPSPRPAVFIATGTGIAPFVSMVCAGVGCFSLLHGVRQPAELYYQSLFQHAGQPPTSPAYPGGLPHPQRLQMPFSDGSPTVSRSILRQKPTISTCADEGI